MQIPTTLRALAAGVVGLALVGCAGSSATDEGSTGAVTADPVSAGGVVRDFVAVTTAGEEVSGESIRGHVTIVDFWAVF